MPERDKHVIRNDRVEHYRARGSDRTVGLPRLTGGGRAERDREAGPANRQLCVHVDDADAERVPAAYRLRSSDYDTKVKHGL
jgi:hypothetical protein